MNIAAAPAQSHFVTILAWILIVFGCLGVAMALMQNAMMLFIVPMIDQLPQSGSDPIQSFPLVAPFSAGRSTRICRNGHHLRHVCHRHGCPARVAGQAAPVASDQGRVPGVTGRHP